ncbi:MAG: hypothetical protein K0R54_1830 [Clostridiaceae bacterium]|jgi:hypothetical protein|nr:hypothetical protein [Clostridiaceae bacterium]
MLYINNHTVKEITENLSINEDTLIFLKVGNLLPTIEVLNTISSYDNNLPSDYFIEENSNVELNDEILNYINVREKYEYLSNKLKIDK